jgi:hypothetical protein
MKPESKPPTSPVHDYLEQLRHQFASLKDGDVATYIPEFAKAKPDWFGICLVTASGAVYEVGDSRADTEVECDVLSLKNFDRLGVSYPATKIKPLKNLSLSLCHRLRKANRELSLFD